MKLVYLFNKAKTLALGAVTAFGLVGFAQAEADLNERYQAADVVALVKIVHVRGLVNTAMSMPGMMAVEAYNYHAAVTHNWKGTRDNATVAFMVSLSDCTQRLQEEQEYVVLSQANKQDQQQSYSCDSLVPKERAESLMANLDALNSTQIAHQLTHR
ncbi:hypothetical protein R50073_12580 [Maricurvus nonylphenolicus]|uniref:hypothetical protein n=1 Tax=Maricurvus nonylphenolicus TaxID=1008307 RepID=UPI0036F36612